MKRYQLTLEDGLYERLTETARATKLSVAELVRRLLYQGLAARDLATPDMMTELFTVMSDEDRTFLMSCLLLAIMPELQGLRTEVYT